MECPFDPVRRERASRKLRLLKLQPNNEQVKNALKDIRYRRKTPTTAMWSHTQISTAKLFKEFCGNFDYNIFNSNHKTAAEALSKLGTVNGSFKLPANVANSPAAKLPYSLMARAHSAGKLVWNQ